MSQEDDGEFLSAFFRGGGSLRFEVVTEEYRSLARIREQVARGDPERQPSGKLQLELQRVLGEK